MTALNARKWTVLVATALLVAPLGLVLAADNGEQPQEYPVPNPVGAHYAWWNWTFADANDYTLTDTVINDGVNATLDPNQGLGNNYTSPGWVNGSGIDIGLNATYMELEINWTADEPAGTYLNLSLGRSDDNMTWTWANDIVSGSTFTQRLTYWIWSAELETTDNQTTPGLEWVSILVTWNAAPVADAGPDDTSGRNTNYTLQGGASSDPDGDPLNYAWVQYSGPATTLNDAATANPWFIPLENGVYVFNLTVSDATNSTEDSVAITVENTPPGADAGMDQVAVRGDNITLNGTDSMDPNGDPITYNWTLLPSSPSSPTINDWNLSYAWFIVDVVGTYTVNLTVTDNQTGTDYDWVDIVVNNQVPVADAGADFSGPVNGITTLDGSASSDPDGDALTYNWTQTAGPVNVTLSNASDAMPTFTTGTSGIYNFTLTVDDGTDSAQDDVSVNVTDIAPVADAGVDIVTVRGAMIDLNGSASSDANGDVLTYSWNQTGGPETLAITGANTSMPQVTVGSTLGTYTFELTVTDPTNLSDTDTVDVTVDNQDPVADAGANQTAYRGQDVTLDGSASSDADGDALTYNWTQTSGPVNVTLSGGNTSQAAFNTTTLGVYTFDLAVDDGNGGMVTDSTTVTVDYAAPVADLIISPDPQMINENVTFDASASYDNDGTIVNYTFDFGDGTNVTTNVSVVDHAYSATGVYTVNLTVTDNDGNTSTATGSVTIFSDIPPTAAINASTNMTTRGVDVSFDANASADDGGFANLSFYWDFGDGSNATGSFVSHAYAALGVFTVTLTVTDVSNQSGSDTLDITVENAGPTATATSSPAAVYRSTLVTLNGSGSSDPEGDALTYNWTQTAGPINVTLSNASADMPTFTPTMLGDYSFNLTVDDGNGGTDTTSITVTVANQPPTADAGADQSVVHGTNVTLNGSASSDPDGDALTYLWEQDLAQSTGAVSLNGANLSMAWFIGATPGTYVFNLTVDDGWDSAMDNVTVNVTNAAPVADAGADQSWQKNVTGLNVTLDGSASSDADGDALTYAWACSPAVTLSDPAAAVTEFNTTGTGTWTCTLTVDDGFDTDADDVAVTVWGLAPNAVINASTNSTLVDAAVTFLGNESTDPDGTIVNWTWDFDDGNVSYGDNASHAWPNAGAYNVTLTVTDDDGNTSTATVAVTVTAVTNNDPDAQATFSPATVYRGTAVTLDGTGSSDPDSDALTYAWACTPTQTLTNGNTATATLTPSAIGTITCTLTVDDGNGGTDSASVTIPVANRGPTLSYTPSATSVDVETGSTQTFAVSGTDPDEDTLTYVWKLDGTVIAGATTASHVFDETTVKTYTLTVNITDGQSFSAERSWTVEVTEKAQQPGSPLLPILIIVIIVVLVLILLLARRKKKPEEEKPEEEEEEKPAEEEGEEAAEEGEAEAEEGEGEAAEGEAAEEEKAEEEMTEGEGEEKPPSA